MSECAPLSRPSNAVGWIALGTANRVWSERNRGLGRLISSLPEAGISGARCL